MQLSHWRCLVITESGKIVIKLSKGTFAICLFFSVFFLGMSSQSNGLRESNIRNLCRMNFVALQTGDCDHSYLPQIPEWCNLYTTAIGDSSITEAILSAGDFVGNERFFFNIEAHNQQNQTGQFLYYGTEHQFSVPLEHLDNYVQTRDGVPQIQSHISPPSLVPMMSIARIWWEDTVTVTAVLPPNIYRLEVYGNNDVPGPVILQVAANSHPLGRIDFDQNDDHWDSRCLWLLPTFWGNDSSNLVLDFRYANDGGEHGNRDASIGWVRLVKYPVE